MFCQLFRELIKIHKSAEVLSFSVAATRKFRVLPATSSHCWDGRTALIILVMMLALLTVHLPHGFFAQSKPGRTSRAARLPSTPFATYSLWREHRREPSGCGAASRLMRKGSS